MDSTDGVLGSDISGTNARHNQGPLEGEGRKFNASNARAFSVDKVVLEKIVLESSNGSREVLLTKSETSRKLSLNTETGPSIVKRTKDGQQKSTVNGRFRVSVPEDAFTSKSHNDLKINFSAGQSKLPLPKHRKDDDVGFPSEENRIKPIKLTKSSSIGSIAIEALSVPKKNKVPPQVPQKPANKRENNSSLISTSVPSAAAELLEDLSSIQEKLNDEIAVEVKQKRPIEREITEENARNAKRDGNDIDLTGIENNGKPRTARKVSDETVEIAERCDARGAGEECAARVDKEAQERLEKSQTTIEDLQKNLETRIHESTAQSYKEELLGLRTNYTLRSITVDSNCNENLSRRFDKDFLEKHNLDKRLKIEEKRLLETDLDYTSDNDRNSETEDQTSAEVNAKRIYGEKVTEVEKRWSGELLEDQLQRNSSESSKSSYIEEFGSVSSRESIVEDRDARLLFDRKRSAKFTERQASIDESKRRTSEEILEDTTVSTVDSDSCLEDRIKAVDEDICQVTNGIETDDNDDGDGLDRVYGDNEEGKVCSRWDEEIENTDSTILTTTAIIHENENLKKESNSDAGSDGYNSRNFDEVKINYTRKAAESEEREPKATNNKNFSIEKNDVVKSTESTDSIVVIRNHHKDGYASLIKAFAMEAGSSKVKKEEKQKRKLGFRCLLPAIFSPKDSRKDYKKKEQKERKRYDERHFARYQQNGNYTRSPDTMNLNEDIKRNVKLDNSLNGSIIEERLDEIKRELFPEQGPITSTPDHFLQADETRLLRDRARTQRSYTTDSSLSSIAPDERWMDRNAQLGISPDIRKYEQRRRREEQDSRRYGHLERKHSLQEPNHGNRNCFFQRNHGPSGRISAPPSERYLFRPRAIHPVDRPLPEIPQSQVELSNYENYQDDVVDRACDGRGYQKNTYVTDKGDYQNQSGLYQNDGSVEVGLIHMPQSVPAQVKITRQPIVNQTQRAPLVGRSPKYPSPGPSQKSGDYADSSCTPNSSQKSEFSPSSSKSGEYYLHSPRSSARASPAERPFDDTRERIYENETPSSISQPSHYTEEEHVYDETPSSPCHEEHSVSTKVADCMAVSLPEKRHDLVCEQRSSQQQSPSKNSFQQTSEDGEATLTGSKRGFEQSHGDYVRNHDSSDKSEPSTSFNQADKMPVRNTSPSRPGTAISPSGPRVLTRKSQPNDQILIASPKREAVYQSRVPRPSNEIRLCDAESPVPIVDSRECISGIVPIEAREQYGSQDSSLSAATKSTGQRIVSSVGFSKNISRPEPIYGHRKQQPQQQPQQQQQQQQQSSPSCQNDTIMTSETKEGGHENEQPCDLYKPTEPCRDIDERTEEPSSRNPQHPSHHSEAKQTLDELEKRGARSPTRESSAATQNVYQQRQYGIIQQRTLSAMSASSSEEQQPSPMTNVDKIYASAHLLQRAPIYDQRTRHYQQQSQQQTPRPNQEAIYFQRSQQQPRLGQEPVCIQRIPESTYGQQGHPGGSGPLSPSKRETRQHLEAFYWQQKALEAQRKTTGSQASSVPKQTMPKIDLPEVREAVYWQQLKKLDEEQQRKIYEQNLTDDGMYEAYSKRRMQTASPMMVVPLSHNANQAFNPNVVVPNSAVRGDTSFWSNAAQQRPKTSPTGKLPLIQAPKGQNQPVLIVRPQQALRDRQELSMKSARPRNPAGCDAQRSKSASPHFHREIERSSFNVTRAKPAADVSGTASPKKPETSSGALHEEDSNDGEGRPRPHPIFKRGSLIGGDTVEYGSTGPKRVSFSNQPNVGPDLAAGNWPTKHGTAPEPPTRRHRSEDSTSDTDSVFLHQDRRDINQDALYVARGASLPAWFRTEIIWPEHKYDANKPLPPLPKDSLNVVMRRGNTARNFPCNDVRWADEEQRVCRLRQEEEWNPDGKGRQSNDTGGSIRGEVEPGSNELTPGRRSGGGGGGGVLGVGAGSGGGGGGSGGRSSSGGGGRSRDEPRRHTLGGDHQPSLHHQQFNAAQQLHPLHPHHLPPPHGQYGTPSSRHITMDLEMGTKSRQRKSPLPRGYPPPSSTMLFDDDPGIMSEVETSSTGFRRGGKQRSSLPVVRTPSKTLERPLGLVFLQYRNETKRALLPNEITSIDTVKALFVRSFPKQLTMEYLDSPHVKVYIHDSNKDMFYELEDERSHLRDIRDRSVLRLFESVDGVTGMTGPLGVPGGGGGLPPHWEDQSYFSEPEFDSEYQHQHIHKSKTAKNSTSGSGYYVGGSSTLPRGGPLLRAYSPAASSVVGGPSSTPTQPKSLTTPDRLHGESGYMSSPERGGGVGSGSGRYPPGPYSAGSSYEDPYYSQYSGTVTPVIDEEARIRVEHMERQLANLTGLVQKALTHAPHTSPSPREYLQVPPGRDPYTRTADDSYLRTDVKPPKLGKDKSVSFEKSVSFSDEPPDMNSPKQHSPQHAADTKPTKPAIKSSTLPRMSSQERDRHKPTPPPKPAALVAGQYVYRDLALTPEMYNQLRGLQKKAKDLRQEVRNLRRMSQAQAHTVRETIRDTFITIRAMLLSGGDAAWTAGDAEKIRLSREEDLYKQEMIRLEKDLTELESTVEELRGNVINRKTRVNMSDVENMALILSKSSKTVADLKVRFPSLQEGMKGLLSSEMEKVVREEKFLKEEPERLECALRRCKKLTGTLVTLKRLASVQEQRLPNAASVDAEDTPPITPTTAQHSKV